MRVVRTFLLGSVASLAAVGAQAADLPARKAAPVEYVRVCSTYGEGFFYIPGSETCLRISGRVRADYVYSEPLDRTDDATNFRVRGRIQADARTSTAYGLLRSVVRFEITRNTGTYFGRENAIGTTPDVAQAFIQFGGLTAGRTTTFFDNSDLPTTHMGTLRFSDAPDVNVLAYTFSFGNGFSATLAIEDGQERRVNNDLFAAAANRALFAGGTGPYDFTYGGQRAPDVVANVKYTGTWGSAQLSGAVHQIRDVGDLGRVSAVTGAPLAANADTEYGFAITGQVGVNLPFLGVGDSAWLAATYTDGALGYILGGSDVGLGAGTVALPLADAYINPFNGDFETTQAYSIAGGVTHNWTPTIRSSLFGSYARFEFDGAARVVDTTTATSFGFIDFNEYRIGANTFWSPVSGLDFGIEVLYTKVDPRGRVAVDVTDVGGRSIGVRTRGSDDTLEGRLRIQRDF